MNFSVLSAVFLPFLGTVIGAAFVFFLKGQMPRRVQRALMGFAAGELRLPLCPPSAANAERIRRALTQYGLLKA